MRNPRRGVQSFVFDLHRARLPVPEAVPSHREGLRQVLAALTEEAGRPLPEPDLSPTVRPLLAGRTPAEREKDDLLCAAWDALAPDQRAALRLAEHLARPQPISPGAIRAGCLGECLLLAGLVWWLFSGAGQPWSGLLAVPVLFWLLWRPLGSQLWGDPDQKAVGEADLKVALALDHPGRYLEALEKLQAAELAGWELIHKEGTMKRPYSHRRERLCARLGFVRKPQPVNSAAAEETV